MLPMLEPIGGRCRRGGKLVTAVPGEVDASLAEIDWRLLHWLQRYPLQRADDLGVGVAR